jgi:hypothetical protein
MAKLKVPSLQHLARNWKETPELTKRGLVNLAKNPPTWSYRPLYGAVQDMLSLGVSYEQIVKSISQKVHRKNVRENLLELLPLIKDHFESLTPDYVQSVERSFYSVRKGLLIPFEPPLVYVVNGEVYLPWFSFWRSNPLAGKRLALFVTLAEEMLAKLPDFEEAKFQILDFSIPAPKEPRQLHVMDVKDIPRLGEQEKSEMLGVFAEGFSLAQEELEKTASTESQTSEQRAPHPDLFD